MENLPTFSIDNFGWVKATGKDGGSVKSQSTEAQLMLAILIELRKLNDTNGVRVDAPMPTVKRPEASEMVLPWRTAGSEGRGVDGVNSLEGKSNE
jgi:hypothetical protein